MDTREWAFRIEDIVTRLRTEIRQPSDNNVETIYLQCRDLIQEGRQVTQAIIGATPEDDYFASVVQTASSLEQQLNILEGDLNRFYEYRNSDDRQTTSQNGFQVQVSYLAVEAQAERLYSTMMLRLGGIREGLGDLKDAIGRTWDNIKGTAQQAAADATAAVGGALSNFGTWLVGWLKLLGTNLLQLIAKLVTPKEWSISGEAGANLLIFQGSVTLEVTFG